MAREDILMALVRARSEIVDVIIDQIGSVHDGTSILSPNIYQRLEALSEEISDVGTEIYGEDPDDLESN
jgi:hypothetical protein